MNRTAICITTVVALSSIGALADEQSSTKSQTSTSSFSSTQSLADDYAGKFGLGIMLGEPTGLSAKYWLNDTLAIDGAAGWSFYEDSEFYLHSDLLVHKFDLIPVPKGKLPFYVGGGAFVRFRDEHHDNEAGVRVPVGLEYLFENAPVDIFVEFAPGIELTPTTRADFSGGIGIRFWF
jgi:hypothetical protein